MQRPKNKYFRSEKYLKYIRRLSCMICQSTPCDAHHICGIGWGLSGMGMKPSDTFCIPLCRTCHTEVHKTPDLQQLQPEWIELTLQAAVIEFEGAMRDELVDALEFVRSRR